MSTKNVLVIDDSTTIRRLCDGELTNAGYHVLLAPTAEEGVATALAQLPDLIILDHQLPGTTGYEVCLQLLANPETAKIPVIASSTLRKKAYAEYLDCDNVVDMLPKPYTPEALIATVESGLNTAQMVVQSQYDGSAVPETIDNMGDPDLCGTFAAFGLREILDLVNNGCKQGVVEVETERCRAIIYVSHGRIQAVTASGVSPEEVSRYMPDALSELAPIIKFTVSGKRGSEVDGLVELLNNKVLDSRLLKKLLRLQAAVLLRLCFTGQLKTFRFIHDQAVPALFEKLPLQCSLLSLLVEGALICDESELPTITSGHAFTRRSIRGQNLDRAGLSSRHMKLMGMLSQPLSPTQVAQELGWAEEEALRVLHGFQLAELVESCQATQTVSLFAVTDQTDLSQRIESLLSSQDEVSGQIVRDWVALRLLLRRQTPHVLMFDLADTAGCEQLNQLVSESPQWLEQVRLIGVLTGDSEPGNLDERCQLNAILSLDSDDSSWLDAISDSSKPTSPNLPAVVTDSFASEPVATSP